MPNEDESGVGNALVVVLGTGGTIAGSAASAIDNVGYRAAELTVDALIAAVPALSAVALQTEQLAQVDSKDMDFAIWQALARRVQAHLSRPEVSGVVVTHGTDTLEETAYFLHRVLPTTKPVVLTAAMRPATSLQADGPQNLLDAVTLVRWRGARGVFVVMAGNVYTSPALRKTDSYRLDAFSAGDAGLLGRLEEGALRCFRPWPVPHDPEPVGLDRISADPLRWPRVEIVFNHAAADGRIVDALLAQGGLDGLVLAGTGNGTLSHPLETAAGRAQEAGVRVLRSTRCPNGRVIDTADAKLPHAGALSPVQARIELLLQLLAGPAP